MKGKKSRKFVIGKCEREELSAKPKKQKLGVPKNNFNRNYRR